MSPATKLLSLYVRGCPVLETFTAWVASYLCTFPRSSQQLKSGLPERTMEHSLATMKRLLRPDLSTDLRTEVRPSDGMATNKT